MAKNAQEAVRSDQDLRQPFASLRDFVEGYMAKQKVDPEAAEREIKATVETRSDLLGKEYVAHARADLIGLRENDTVWSSGGWCRAVPALQ